MTKTDNGVNTPTTVTSTINEYFESIKSNQAALRQFFTEMPKGGDLHNHLTGSAYAETYFELAAKKGMYVDMATGKLYKDKPEGIETIRLSKEMDALHNHRMTLIDKWSIRNFQPYKYPLGPDEYFFGTFGLLSALTSDIDDLAYLMHELKVRAVRENVQYLEVMASSPSVPADCFLGEEYAAYDALLKDCVKNGTYDKARAILEAIINKYYHNSSVDDKARGYLSFIQELEDKSNNLTNHLGIDPKKVICRYQGYASRGGEPLKVLAQLYLVHRACSPSENKLLVGCNIVAAENGEKSMLYYRLHMEMFAALAEKFPDRKAALHAGELTLGLGRPEHLTYHIRRAVATAKAARIGHGVDMPFEQDCDRLLKEMKDRRIPVEINLTSNEFILGVKDGEHPITLYSLAGVPIVICTDDPGILRTSLTEQYVLAALRYGYPYFWLRQVAYNSIRYAFLNQKEKDGLIKTLNDLLTAFEKKYTNVRIPAESEGTTPPANEPNNPLNEQPCV